MSYFLLALAFVALAVAARYGPSLLSAGLAVVGVLALVFADASLAGMAAVGGAAIAVGMVSARAAGRRRTES